MSSIAMAADSTQEEVIKRVKRRRPLPMKLTRKHSRKRDRSSSSSDRSRSRDDRTKRNRAPYQGRSHRKRRYDDDDYGNNKSSDHESDLDLSKDLLPISGYVRIKEEIVHHMFRSISSKKLRAMLPEILKSLNLEELKHLCVEQLEVMSKKRICRILDGADPENISSSGTDELSSGQTTEAEDATSLRADQEDVLNSSRNLPDEDDYEDAGSLRKRYDTAAEEEAEYGGGREDDGNGTLETTMTDEVEDDDARRDAEEDDGVVDGYGAEPEEEDVVPGTAAAFVGGEERQRNVKRGVERSYRTKELDEEERENGDGKADGDDGNEMERMSDSGSVSASLPDLVSEPEDVWCFPVIIANKSDDDVDDAKKSLTSEEKIEDAEIDRRDDNDRHDDDVVMAQDEEDLVKADSSDVAVTTEFQGDEEETRSERNCSERKSDENDADGGVGRNDAEADGGEEEEKLAVEMKHKADGEATKASAKAATTTPPRNSSRSFVDATNDGEEMIIQVLDHEFSDVADDDDDDDYDDDDDDEDSNLDDVGCERNDKSFESTENKSGSSSKVSPSVDGKTTDENVGPDFIRRKTTGNDVCDGGSKRKSFNENESSSSSEEETQRAKNGDRAEKEERRSSKESSSSGGNGFVRGSTFVENTVIVAAPQKESQRTKSSSSSCSSRQDLKRRRSTPGVADGKTTGPRETTCRRKVTLKKAGDNRSASVERHSNEAEEMTSGKVDSSVKRTSPGRMSSAPPSVDGGTSEGPPSAPILSKTQLEILELEMRARAIKAMLKAQEELEKREVQLKQQQQRSACAATSAAAAAQTSRMSRSEERRRKVIVRQNVVQRRETKNDPRRGATGAFAGRSRVARNDRSAAAARISSEKTRPVARRRHGLPSGGRSAGGAHGGGARKPANPSKASAISYRFQPSTPRPIKKPVSTTRGGGDRSARIVRLSSSGGGDGEGGPTRAGGRSVISSPVAPKQRSVKADKVITVGGARDVRRRVAASSETARSVRGGGGGPSTRRGAEEVRRKRRETSCSPWRGNYCVPVGWSRSPKNGRK